MVQLSAYLHGMIPDCLTKWQMVYACIGNRAHGSLKNNGSSLINVKPGFDYDHAGSHALRGNLSWTLRVLVYEFYPFNTGFIAALVKDAERPVKRSHAERGSECESPLKLLN